MTAAQIADRLGDVSRNAVIGKAHRLGLSQPKPAMPRAPTQVKVARKLVMQAPQPEVPRAPIAPPPPPDPDVRAEDLPWHRRCQWPIGHPGDPEFHFCGAPAAESKPYCNNHCTMAYRQKDEAA